ncbi:thioesterase II family protein [Plantactinospora endophytica]|uniref:Thioesterase n=1 Tax=Plantactinospora endophytica TaxID=673535 RepID=A0ABQ4E0R2_9ACTN|nr:alpha/beta fold hydrolase [Plantactinospora endophytica]GIG88303.1 thioesterase [Plantactinospora endophytica]
MSTYGRVTNDWFLRYAAAPRATLRLVCFPHAGGGAAAYRRWAELVPESIEVIGVQYPGRQNRYGEPVIDDMTTLVDEIVAAAERELSGPVALFGHSMGAVVAFEVARRWQAGDSITVRRLFASAGPAPSARRSLGVHLRDDDGLVAYVRELGGDAELLELDEIRQLTLPMVRSDLRLIETYRYAAGEPLNCPVTAFVGDRDHTFTTADARHWVLHTSAGLEVRSLPGGHFYLDDQADRLVPMLVERLLPR